MDTFVQSAESKIRDSETDDQQTKLTVSEAGRRGGLTTLSRYGREHFQKAGRKGQASLSAKLTQDQRREWGRQGGRPRKKRYRGEEA